ncbi:MAG: ATP-binding cassette domain-containing protein [Nitrososphaerales archaeon]|jgi:ABC-2 type transport system ATP-binding protein
MLVAEGLTKSYGDSTIVDRVSFAVNEGEIFGFLGPNGAGKTTTIRMLTTLASISGGRCSVAGYDVRSEPGEVRRNIGIVPQDYSTDNELTGMENLLLTADLYRVPRSGAEKKIGELVSLVKLQDALHRRVKTYSGGMRKRLELIAGLVHEPRILFLDEPTLGLDVQTRTAIWEYVLDLRKGHGMTIFMTTHYLEEADSLCDSVAIIDRGRIVATGSPSELKAGLGGGFLRIELAPGPSASERLSRVEGVVEVVERGDVYQVKVRSPDLVLGPIIAAVHATGRSVLDMSIVRPTLDQVFLSVTGRNLREEVPAGESRWKTAEAAQSRRR